MLLWCKTSNLGNLIKEIITLIIEIKLKKKLSFKLINWLICIENMEVILNRLNKVM